MAAHARARLSKEEEETWMLLLALLEYLPLMIDKQLRRDSGLGRYEYGVLLALERAENHTAPMLELSKVSFGSISRLSHAITSLSDRGYVVRERQGARRLVTITDEGRRVLRAAVPDHVRQLRSAVFDHLGPGDARRLADMLEPIVEDLKEWGSTLT